MSDMRRAIVIHVLAVTWGPLVFVVLALATTLNPIYSSAIALVAGFFATPYCRPDLWLKMIVSGGLFFAVYFIVFILFNLAFPGYVAAVTRHLPFGFSPHRPYDAGWKVGATHCRKWTGAACINAACRYLSTSVRAGGSRALRTLPQALLFASIRLDLLQDLQEFVGLANV